LQVIAVFVIFKISQYDEIEPGKFDFYHTFTPPAYRGQGIASKIANVTISAIDKIFLGIS
jgi:predicted GNAT family acetyltransferase